MSEAEIPDRAALVEYLVTKRGRDNSSDLAPEYFCRMEYLNWVEIFKAGSLKSLRLYVVSFAKLPLDRWIQR